MPYDIWDYLNLNVPLNDKGIEELESNVIDLNNVYTVHLEKADYSELNDLFDLYNKRFGILIDFCEEELLENKYLSEACQLLENYLKERPSAEEAGSKLKKALDKGIETGYFVMFCL